MGEDGHTRLSLHAAVVAFEKARDAQLKRGFRVMFAQGLEGLGQRWRCEPLVHYAQKLLLDAENYAVTDLEKHLGEFAAQVEQLEQGASA